MSETGAPYPGAMSGPREVVKLAAEHHAAARLLSAFGRKGEPISRAPFRMVAIHAIELYLNAYLLHAGLPPQRIRGLQHDLSARTDLALEYGLRLRRRTAAHLRTMSEAREYLLSRYEPDRSSSCSQINRLSATLIEVADKVTAIVLGKDAPHQPVRPDGP